MYVRPSLYLPIPSKYLSRGLSVHPNSLPDTSCQAPNLSHSGGRVRLIILLCPLTLLSVQCTGDRWRDTGEGGGEMGQREGGKWEREDKRCWLGGK